MQKCIQWLFMAMHVYWWIYKWPKPILDERALYYCTCKIEQPCIQCMYIQGGSPAAVILGCRGEPLVAVLEAVCSSSGRGRCSHDSESSVSVYGSPRDVSLCTGALWEGKWSWRHLMTGCSTCRSPSISQSSYKTHRSDGTMLLHGAGVNAPWRGRTCAAVSAAKPRTAARSREVGHGVNGPRRCSFARSREKIIKRSDGL